MSSQPTVFASKSNTIPGIALILSVLLVFPKALAEEKLQWSSFDSAGVSIHYLIGGKGDPVVLIHGLYSSAEINWQMPGTIKALLPEHQVIALDVRGHGKSDKPKEEEAYGIQMVEDITRLLDHLKIEKAHIIGYSMGGMIALKFISKHPERSISGTLGGMGWLRDGGLLQKFWEGIPDNGKGLVPPACLKGFAQFALTENELKSVHVPVTVLVGDRDICRTLYVAPLAAVRKDWPVKEIEGAGHLDCIVKPQFISELNKSLEKSPSAAP